MVGEDEKELQQSFPWARQKYYADYTRILAYYQAKSVLEHARGDTLLDMPCGDGTLTKIFAGRFRRVVGVDASKIHLSEARKLLPAVTFYEALIEDFDIDERFQTIAMINVLEHVVDPVLALRRAAELLADDGILIAHVPNAQAINRRIAVSMGTLTECEELSPFDIQVAGHRRSYSLATLCKDVAEAGLRVVSTGGVFYKMLSTPQMDWLLKTGPWEGGEFGWGRVGGSKKDWRAEFCRACYEIGKEKSEDCNVIYVCAAK